MQSSKGVRNEKKFREVSKWWWEQLLTIVNKYKRVVGKLVFIIKNKEFKMDS